jgi:hypothetical protein
MDRRDFLAQAIRCGVVGGGVVSLTGCGTIFHRERVGQPHSRDIDWKVAALNGLGLVLFFVPGVVAFAVDFYTGAIYMPYETCGPSPEQPYFEPSAPIEVSHSANHSQVNQWRQLVTNDLRSADQQRQLSLHIVGTERFRKIEIAPVKLDQPSIENAVAHHVGKTIALTDSGVRISRLPHLEQFGVAHRQHRLDPKFGLSPRQFFKGLPFA